jgi:hypothetical protein
MSDTGLLIFGDVATAVAAVAAAITVGVTVSGGRKNAKELEKVAESQKETVGAIGDVAMKLQESAELAQRSIEQAERSRLLAEKDRLRHTYEEIGRLVEELFQAGIWRGPGFSGTEFHKPRNQLAIAIIGHEEKLPRCATATLCNSCESAVGNATTARVEIQAAIKQLSVTT